MVCEEIEMSVQRPRPAVCRARYTLQRPPALPANETQTDPL